MHLRSATRRIAEREMRRTLVLPHGNHPGLEFRQEGEVLLHVGRQHQLDDRCHDLSTQRLRDRLHEVEFAVPDHLQGLVSAVILEDDLLVEAPRSQTICGHLEVVVQARVPIVMDHRSKDHSQEVAPACRVGGVKQLVGVQHGGEPEEDIRRVGRIVVRLVLIPCLDFRRKPREAGTAEVQACKEVVLVHDFQACNLERPPFRYLLQIERVEEEICPCIPEELFVLLSDAVQQLALRHSARR
mmetsp:Transcript_30317/g.72132  ORF Transcript_30317/g.72132 Transcript_30317/m.72132 type:complete len:242 (+) Transcript_30317:414-1139(+)